MMRKKTMMKKVSIPAVRVRYIGKNSEE